MSALNHSSDLEALTLGVSTGAAYHARPTAGVFPQAPAPSSRAPVEFECAIGGCRSLQADWHTGFCDYHQTRFMDHVHDHTRGLGRGELP